MYIFINLLLVLISSVIAYYKGQYDVHTNLMRIARFGDGKYVVLSPNYLAVYKIEKVGKIK